MKKLTKRKALELTAQMWDIMAEGHNQLKLDAFDEMGIKYNEEPIHNCFLCEYVAQKTGEIPYTDKPNSCVTCPLTGHWSADGKAAHCQDSKYRAYFSEWEHSLMNQRRWAKKIADACREVLADMNK